MAQSDFGTIDSATKSGPALADDLNAWRDAVHSTHKGVSRPAYATAGMLWIKEVSSSNWEVYMYDGDTDIFFRAFNPATNLILPTAVVAGGTGAGDASTARTNLGVAIGSDVQAYNAKLAALVGLTGAADKMFYFTGTNSMATADLPSQARTLLAATTTALQRTALGLAIGTDVQAYNAKLAALVGLTGAADKLFYFTGTNSMATADLPAQARTFLAASSTALQRTALGLVIGTDVQAYDADTAKTDVAQSYTKAQRGTPVALTDAATVAVDLSLGNFFYFTIGGNRTLGQPTNMVAGQSGTIQITQDGTGSRTLAYHADWLFPGGNDPALSTAIGAIDLLCYQVNQAGTKVYANLLKGFA